MNASDPSSAASNQTTLDALRVVKDYAESVKRAVDDSLVDKPFDVLTDETIDSVFAVALTKEESGSLLKTLRAINDAVAAVKEAFLRKANELTEAAAAEKKELEKAAIAEKKDALKRMRYALGAVVSLIVLVVAFWAREERVAYASFICFVAFVAPELVANLSGVWKERSS